MDERDCQCVERVMVELARRVNEHFLRFRNHARQRQSQAGKRLVQSTGACGWTVGFDRCFEILLSGHLSINSWSSFLGKGFADLISFHGAMPGGGIAVRAGVLRKWEACLKPGAGDSAIMMATPERPWQSSTAKLHP